MRDERTAGRGADLTSSFPRDLHVINAARIGCE
jgi:hypothetical protein